MSRSGRVVDAAATVSSSRRAPDASSAARRVAIPGLAVRGVGGAARLTVSRAPIEDLDSLPYPRRTPEVRRMCEANIAGSRGYYRIVHVLHHPPVLRRRLSLATAVAGGCDRRDDCRVGGASRYTPLLLRRSQLLRSGGPRPQPRAQPRAVDPGAVPSAAYSGLPCRAGRGAARRLGAQPVRRHRALPPPRGGLPGRDHTAAAHRLAGLNRSLVGLFEHLLDGLDGGGLRPSAELAADVVGEARAWVAQAV